MGLDRCIRLWIHYHSQDTEQLNYPQIYFVLNFYWHAWALSSLLLLSLEPNHAVAESTAASDTFHEKAERDVRSKG